MAPSSRFASSLKPSVAYLDLNFCAPWKKQTTLPSLAYAGIPYQSLRREDWRAGFDDRMEPLAHGAIRFRHLGDLREHGALPVRLVRARPRRASAFSSWARSFIATRSSSVNPVDAVPVAVLLLADFCVPFFAGFLSAIAKHLRAPNESPHRSCSSPRTLPSGSVTVATRRPPPTSCAGSFTVAPAAVTSASFASMSGTCQ